MKKDLHVHLHGCLKPEDLWKAGKDSYKNKQTLLEGYALEYEKAWGKKPNYKNYWENENGFELLKRDYLFLERNSFERFQASFNLIIALCPILTNNFYVQENVIKNMNASGLDYFEARTVIPFYFTAEETYDYLKGLCRSVKDLNTTLPMTTKLVFILSRENSMAKKHYGWLRLFIEKHPDLAEAIAGLDFAFREEGSPPKSKKNLFEEFKKDNRNKKPLDLLYHVGESFRDKSLTSSIRWVFEAHELGATRLGHAIALGADPRNYKDRMVSETEEERQDTLRWLSKNGALLKEAGYEKDERSLQKAALRILKEKGAVIECCPTSNLRIGGIKDRKYHPLKAFHESGVKYVIGTDDPGIFATNFEQEVKEAALILTPTPNELK